MFESCRAHFMLPHVGSKLLAGVVAVLCVGSGVAGAAVSPSQVVSAALAKARAQRSVHYVSSQVSGDTSVTIDGDAVRDRGIQRITYRKGGRVGHLTVVVVANVAYVRGDTFTLTNYMRIPLSSSSGWAGKWLSLARSAPDFAAVAAAVRLVSTIAELTIPPPFRYVGTSTRQGRHVVGIASHFQQAGHAITETLYVDVARSLPVQLVGKSGTTTITGTFSRWNEHVSVAAPASAIAIR
jgi:hypothetical protein